jgi:NAD(P)-dependent dehydrogenase (short-subunit alcohol dehydrogenase family)
MPLDTEPLAGKTAVVLGGCGGIGFAVAELFAKAGAAVAVVASRDPARAAQAAARLEGGGHRGYACLIEHSDRLALLADRVGSDMDGADILVNSAGFTRPVPHADLEAMDDETFDRILTVNTRAAFAAIRAFAPQLRSQGDGLVVQISSIAATTAAGSCVAYSAAKAAMDVIGMALARALAPEIRVLSVSPSVVDTDFVPGRDKAARERTVATTPLRRLCTPQDVAEAVLACATTLRYATGTVIQVDGGRHLQ